MTYLVLGFMTGMSLILALGPQNIFVIEQGLKKEFIFLVCLICSVSDALLIFLGIFIFYYFQVFFTPLIEFILNLLLLIFLLYFIWNKIRKEINRLNLNISNTKKSLPGVVFKTLGFTYLNPHVYSDTVFFLGNFSKDLLLKQKLFFGLGASLSSFIFFFIIGYMSKYLSNYLRTEKIWKIINILIIIFMSFLAIYVFQNIIRSIQVLIF
ncbi:MAG TPA: lysine transporter LysE [Candidatus Pelagibacter sp.]|jgi:L-lysine exporter family protein LysE/ArgO|nr:lysine transporter LysE [Candidatus Pelagibacter sp.]